jgi:hypothetical protein
MNNSLLKKIDFLIEDLENFSNLKDSYDWVNEKGPDYYENLLTWEDSYSYFKSLIKNNEISLSNEQIRSILKINVMLNTFDRVLMNSQPPEDWRGYNEYILNHPYWIKLAQQAKCALDLLKK